MAVVEFRLDVVSSENIESTLRPPPPAQDYVSRTLELLIFWPHTHPNPNCTLRQMNDKDTWPHLLSLYNNKFLKGLTIARHNAVAHQLTDLLKSNLFTRHLTLVNVGNQHGNLQDNTIPPWILSCICNSTRCECLAKLRPNIIYIQGVAYEQNGS